VLGGSAGGLYKRFRPPPARPQRLPLPNIATNSVSQVYNGQWNRAWRERNRRLYFKYQGRLMVRPGAKRFGRFSSGDVFA